MFSLFKKKKKETKNDSNLLDITYSMSSGIPFRWEYEIEDKTLCEFVRIDYEAEKTKEPICGGQVDSHYLFKGLKEGKTKIIFKLINFGDNYLSEINTYTIKVDENNIITVLNKEEKKM